MGQQKTNATNISALDLSGPLSWVRLCSQCWPQRAASCQLPPVTHHSAEQRVKWCGQRWPQTGAPSPWIGVVECCHQMLLWHHSRSRAFSDPAAIADVTLTPGSVLMGRRNGCLWRAWTNLIQSFILSPFKYSLDLGQNSTIKWAFDFLKNPKSLLSRIATFCQTEVFHF